MKGYFINLINFKSKEDLNRIGVHKKVLSQCKEISKVLEVIHELHNGYRKNRINLLRKIWIRLPFTAIMYKWKYDERYSKADFVYFRKAIIDRSVIVFLKKIKSNNSKVKILFEVATYPYDKEINGMKNLPFLLKDRFNRKKIYRYVDRIVTTSQDDCIFGVKTIKMMNGLDFDKISPRQCFSSSGTIHIIAVSTFAQWHGYDRFLRGMGQYYANGGKREIIFHMVGDGASLQEYKEIIEQYAISDKVIIYGNKSGKNLDDIYDKCSIAVASLGLHRINLFLASTLKTREYGAKGLPIITSTKIDYIPDDYKYQLKFSEDESAINMEQVIDFFDRIYQTEGDFEKVNKEIREFAEKKCDISITMRPVVEYILGED